MKVSAIKQLIDPLELDPEVKQRIYTLICNFNDSDEVPIDIKNQILELLDLEIETNELLAQTYDQLTGEIDKYNTGLSQVIADKITEIN